MVGETLVVAMDTLHQQQCQAEKLFRNARSPFNIAVSFWGIMGWNFVVFGSFMGWNLMGFIVLIFWSGSFFLGFFVVFVLLLSLYISIYGCLHGCFNDILLFFLTRDVDFFFHAGQDLRSAQGHSLCSIIRPSPPQQAS